MPIFKLIHKTNWAWGQGGSISGSLFRLLPKIVLYILTVFQISPEVSNQRCYLLKRCFHLKWFVCVDCVLVKVDEAPLKMESRTSWCSSGEESAFQCMGLRFDPWSGNLRSYMLPACCNEDPLQSK